MNYKLFILDPKNPRIFTRSWFSSVCTPHTFDCIPSVSWSLSSCLSLQVSVTFIVFTSVVRLIVALLGPSQSQWNHNNILCSVATKRRLESGLVF